MADKFNFTKTDLERLKAPKTRALTYRDTKEKGLSLYITPAGSISFFIRKRIRGRDERIILGQFPVMSVGEAREAALTARSEVAKGKNPNAEKHKLQQETTFGQLFKEYMERYSKPNKKSWQYDEREVKKFLSHWFTRKLSSITKHEVQKLLDKITRENGLYQSNRTLERVRAIYNKGLEWGWDGINPALGLKKHRERSRDRFILPHELPLFHEALRTEPNPIARDYFLILLLTGARKTNVLTMQWVDINWEHKQWRIPDTKNGEPITIPLTETAMNILTKRKAMATGPWVFPSENGGVGHFVDPKRAWQRIREKTTLAIWELIPEVADRSHLT